MDPLGFLGLSDPIDSMIGQSILHQAEKQADDYAEKLAVKIRNQIAEMLK